jgi:hypothetical protein
MAREFSAHQQRIIRAWYQNRDAIDAQRLTELVTELWLAQGNARKSDKLWERARGILSGIPDLDEQTIAKLVLDRDVETLAGIAEARFLAD